MSINKDSQKAPNLRFKGFTDDWEQRKLKDVSERVRGNDGRMELPTLTISAGKGWLDQRDRFSGNIAGKEQKNYTLLSENELSYNKGNSKLAKYGVVFKLSAYKEALVPRVYHSFRTNKEANPDYIEYMFATKLPDRELGKLVTSGARMDGLLNINYDDFIGIKIKIPSLAEQSKISILFIQLDNLITLHQRKLDQLNQLKEALLQQMFPGKGETVPKLRFAGFEGDWEERKLGEISEMYQPQTITGQDLTNSGYPVFGANGYIGYFSKYNHKSNQVTISARGEGTGTPSYVNGPVWITGNSMVINVDKNGINKMFLYTNLLSFSLKKYVTGGAQPQLVREVLTNVPIKIPSNEEQNKLGYFFGQLNANIINNKKKISNLQSLKQVLLQNMFI